MMAACRFPLQLSELREGGSVEQDRVAALPVVARATIGAGFRGGVG